jgi:hypothetical protein
MLLLRRYRFLALLLAALLPILAAAPALAAVCSGMSGMDAHACCHGEKPPAESSHCPSGDAPASDGVDGAQTCCAAAPAIHAETAATPAPEAPRVAAPTFAASLPVAPPAPYVACVPAPVHPPGLRPHLTNAVLLI